MQIETGAIYLSRLVFNPRSRTVQQALADCHHLHQTVMRGFRTVNSDSARKALEVLYRPEVDGRTGAFVTLVQSSDEPDWSELARSSGQEAPVLVHLMAAKRIDPALDSVRAGDRLRFRLRANPTKRLVLRTDEGGPVLRADGRSKPGPRVPLCSTADQLEWLERKAEAIGVKFASADARPDRFGGQRQTGRKAGTGRMTLDAVVFDGELVVADALLFRRSVIAGIGSGKAYGFGLLSVAPAG